jgi:hypothetical protein
LLKKIRPIRFRADRPRRFRAPFLRLILGPANIPVKLSSVSGHQQKNPFIIFDVDKYAVLLANFDTVPNNASESQPAPLTLASSLGWRFNQLHQQPDCPRTFVRPPVIMIELLCQPISSV